MVAPIIVPEMQFCDQNGTPLAGASITTYIMDTSTPKATWLDPQQSALQTNPAILDAAGRVRLYGDGDYRLVLKDILGNLIWDTPATTIVSAAMEPVVSAPTIPDALNLLGVNALISAEATARSNADSAEQSARIAADKRRGRNTAAYDTAIQTNITTRRPPASPPTTTSRPDHGAAARHRQCGHDADRQRHQRLGPTGAHLGDIPARLRDAHAGLQHQWRDDQSRRVLLDVSASRHHADRQRHEHRGYRIDVHDRRGDRQHDRDRQCRVHLVCDRALSDGSHRLNAPFQAVRSWRLTGRLAPPGVGSSWRSMPAQASA